MKIQNIYIFLVISGAILYVFSLFSPLLSIREFYIFSDTVTIVSVLNTLLSGDELFLFIIILVFAIILPSLKYILLIFAWFNPDLLKNKTASLLEAMTKWAMLDVFIIAIIVASIKLKVFSSVETHFGLYLFAVSVLISIVCTQIKKT